MQHKTTAGRTWAATACAALALALPATSVAGTGIGHRHVLGLGVAAGSLSLGPSAKFYWGHRRAVQAVLGWYPGGAWSVSADAVWEFGPQMPRYPGRLHFGIGPGVGLLVADDGAGGSAKLAALSLVLEVGWQFQAVPLELVLGFRPTWRSGGAGGSTTYRAGAGAVRWYF